MLSSFHHWLSSASQLFQFGSLAWRMGRVCEWQVDMHTQSSICVSWQVCTTSTHMNGAPCASGEGGLGSCVKLHLYKQRALVLMCKAPLVQVESAHVRSSIHVSRASMERKCFPLMQVEFHALAHCSREWSFTRARLPISPAAQFQTGCGPLLGHSLGVGDRRLKH